MARAKRERVVQDGVEKANRRHGPAPLAPYLKFGNLLQILQRLQNFAEFVRNFFNENC